MSLPFAYLSALIASYFWPFVRLSSMMMVMVVFGTRMMPTFVRLVFSVAVTAAIVPLLPLQKLPFEIMSLPGFLVTIREALIGILIGFATEFLSQTFVLAGSVVAMQTGLGFAAFMDPVNGESVPVVGQFFSTLCALVFLSIDGHIAVISMTRESFITLPPGLYLLAPSSWMEMAMFLGVMFQAAVSFALASIVAMLVINFTFGIMTRAAPQLNIFSMGFAVSMVLGIIVLWLTVSGFLSHFSSLWSRVQSLIGTVTGAL